MNLSIGGSWVDLLRWTLALSYSVTAIMCLIARRHWGHRLINPALTYATVIFGLAALFRWLILYEMLAGFPRGTIRNLILNGSVQLTISMFIPTTVIVLLLGVKKSRETAQNRQAHVLQKAERLLK